MQKMKREYASLCPRLVDTLLLLVLAVVLLLAMYVHVGPDERCAPALCHVDRYEELRKNHEHLRRENEEVRKIVGDMCAPASMWTTYPTAHHVEVRATVFPLAINLSTRPRPSRYVSVDEDRAIRESYLTLYKEIM